MNHRSNPVGRESSRQQLQPLDRKMKLPAATRKDFIAACQRESRKLRGKPEGFSWVWGDRASTALRPHSDEGSFCEGGVIKIAATFALHCQYAIRHICSPENYMYHHRVQQELQEPCIILNNSPDTIWHYLNATPYPHRQCEDVQSDRLPSYKGHLYTRAWRDKIIQYTVIASRVPLAASAAWQSRKVFEDGKKLDCHGLAASQ